MSTLHSCNKSSSCEWTDGQKKTYRKNIDDLPTTRWVFVLDVITSQSFGGLYKAVKLCILGMSIKPHKRKKIHKLLIHVGHVSTFFLLANLEPETFSLCAVKPVWRCSKEGLGLRWRRAKNFHWSRPRSINCAGGADGLRVCLGTRSCFEIEPTPKSSLLRSCCGHRPKSVALMVWTLWSSCVIIFVSISCEWRLPQNHRKMFHSTHDSMFWIVSFSFYRM